MTTSFRSTRNAPWSSSTPSREDLPGGGEDREGQREMVRSVASAFSRRRHHLIEAGTGVGKSLAYLVPVGARGSDGSSSRPPRRTSRISWRRRTHPRSPVTRRACTSPCLKGKQNYLCLNRAQSLGGGAQLSLDDGTDVPRGVADQMRRILRWGNDTTTGRPRRASLRSRRSRPARGVGHPPGVSPALEVPPGPKLLRRARKGPRERELDSHRERAPLRLPPRVGIDAPPPARVRRLRRGPRDPRHLRDVARHVAQCGATARARDGRRATC